MSARDITTEQLTAVDLFISGPPGGNPKKARARQVCTAARMIVAVDKLLAEAADCRIAAPGLLEIRDWLVLNIETNCAAAMPSLDIRPDPVKDAVAGSNLAARRGTSADYQAARKAEAEARAAA